MEPHVKLVSKEQHIDYQFNGLEDDDSHEIEDEDDDADDDDDDYYGQRYVGRDDGELSFDYGRNGHAQVNKSTFRHSMEVNIYLYMLRNPSHLYSFLTLNPKQYQLR